MIREVWENDRDHVRLAIVRSSHPAALELGFCSDVAALRHKVAVRNRPPPNPYTSWDEHDEDMADRLQGELRARRKVLR